MKAIDLANSSPSLSEVLELAGEENIVLRTLEGRTFVLAEIDDFAEEVALTRQNEALMQLLDSRSKEETTFTLDQVRKQLKADTGRKTHRKKRGA
jgi:hypothetical protein